MILHHLWSVTNHDGVKVPAESKYIRYRSLFDVFKQSHRMVYAPDGCSHARSILFEADRIQPASKSAGPGRRPDPLPAIGADPAMRGKLEAIQREWEVYSEYKASVGGKLNLGWTPYCAKPIRRVRIPGDHPEIIREPGSWLGRSRRR